MYDADPLCQAFENGIRLSIAPVLARHGYSTPSFTWQPERRFVVARFDSVCATISIWYTRGYSYEIDLTLRSTAFPDDPIGIVDLLAAQSSQIESADCLMASTVDRVELCLGILKSWVEAIDADVWQGEEDALRSAFDHRSKAAALASGQLSLQLARSDLDAAWRAKDWPRFIALHDKLDSQLLTKADLAKLAYAQKQSQR